MHSSNSIQVAFIFGILSSNTPFNVEDFVTYFILVGDTFGILPCIVASDLLAFVIGD